MAQTHSQSSRKTSVSVDRKTIESFLAISVYHYIFLATHKFRDLLLASADPGPVPSQKLEKLPSLSHETILKFLQFEPYIQEAMKGVDLLGSKFLYHHRKN